MTLSRFVLFAGLWPCSAWGGEEVVKRSCDSPSAPTCWVLSVKDSEAFVSLMPPPASTVSLGRVLSRYRQMVLPGEIPVRELRFPSGHRAVLSWGFPLQFTLYGNGVMCSVYVFSSEGKLLRRIEGDYELKWFQSGILAGRGGEVVLFSTSGGPPIALTTQVLRIANGKVESILSMNAAIIGVHAGPDKSLSELVLRVPVPGEGSSTDRWKNVTLVWNVGQARFTSRE